MLNVRKTLQMTSLLFGMVLLFCYIAWHLGYDGLLLVGDVDIPMWLNKAICVVFFSINYIFIVSFSLKEYSRKAIFIALPFLGFYAISAYLFPSTIFSGPVATSYVVLWIFIRRNDIKWSLFRIFLSSALTIIYQMIAIVLKTGTFSLNYQVSIYTFLMFSIDMVIFSALLWGLGGVKNGGSSLEFLVFPGRIRDNHDRDEIRESDAQSPETVPVNKFEVWVMRSVIGVVQILQWMFILWVCNLDNLFWDALVMTTSFICHGMIIMKREHLKPIILCTLAATAMFYFAARFTISFQYSQFFPIVIGLILVYTIYRVSYQFEKKAKAVSRDKLERIKKLERQVEEAWSQIDELS